MTRASILNVEQMYDISWEPEDIENGEAPELNLDTDDGTASIISEDGCCIYDLHNETGPAYEDETRVAWALDGLLHRLDGPALFIEGGEPEAQYFVLGIEVSEQQLVDNRAAFEKLTKFLDQEGIFTREFNGDKWTEIDTIEELLGTLEAGEIVVKSGPRGFEQTEVVKVELKNESGSGVATAIGAAGVLGFVALAGRALSENQKRKAAQKVVAVAK